MNPLSIGVQMIHETVLCYSKRNFFKACASHVICNSACRTSEAKASHDASPLGQGNSAFLAHATLRKNVQLSYKMEHSICDS